MPRDVYGVLFGLLWFRFPRFKRLDLKPPARVAVGIENGCITDVQAAVMDHRFDGVCHRSERIDFSQAGKLTHLTYSEDLSLAY